MSLTEGELNNSNLLNGVSNVLTNPIGTGIIGAVGGAVVGGLVVSAATRRRKRRKSRNSRSRSCACRGRKSKKRKHSKRTSHRRIRYTKNNQPYVIMPNGRARFISKSSARRSRRMKGGRY